MTPEELLAVVPSARTSDAWGRLVADVPRTDWVPAAAALRAAGHELFDLLTAVDLQADGVEVVLHLWSVGERASVLLRTRCPADDLHVASLAALFAGAAWHERHAAEMFGLVFDGHPGLAPLLLSGDFQGAPLRKDFVLASRTVRPWPGAPEPGQSSAEAAVGRRRTLPPGVPAPGTWGPSS